MVSGSAWRALLVLRRLYTLVFEPSGSVRDRRSRTRDDFRFGPTLAWNIRPVRAARAALGEACRRVAESPRRSCQAKKPRFRRIRPDTWRPAATVKGTRLLPRGSGLT